jgi:hypothetical protein
MQQLEEKKKPELDKTSFQLPPELGEAVRSRIATMRTPEGRRYLLQDAVKDALVRWLLPPTVIHWQILTTEERRLVDGVVDMKRNPRDDAERTILALVENFITIRNKC